MHNTLKKGCSCGASDESPLQCLYPCLEDALYLFCSHYTSYTMAFDHADFFLLCIVTQWRASQAILACLCRHGERCAGFDVGQVLDLWCIAGVGKPDCSTLSQIFRRFAQIESWTAASVNSFLFVLPSTTLDTLYCAWRSCAVLDQL